MTIENVTHLPEHYFLFQYSTKLPLFFGVCHKYAIHITILILGDFLKSVCRMGEFVSEGENGSRITIKKNG